MARTSKQLEITQDLIERTRALAEHCDDDAALDFYSAALRCGATSEQADEITTLLNARVMRAKGGI
jgi:hypothetical protein